MRRVLCDAMLCTVLFAGAVQFSQCVSAQEQLDNLELELGGPVFSVVYLDSGKKLAAVERAKVAVFDAKSGERVGTMETVEHANQGGIGTYFQLSLSPDGSVLAGGHSDGSAVIWDTQNGKLKSKIHVSDGSVTALIAARAGELIATSGLGCSLRFWDTLTHNELAALKCHPWGLRCIAHCPDLTTIVTAGEDGSVQLWSLTKLGELWRVMVGTHPILSLGFSPNGTLIAAGGQDKCVHIIDLTKGLQVSMLTEHDEDVCSVQILSDNRTLISASEDGTVRATNIETKETLGQLVIAERKGGILSMAVSPDESTVACGGMYGVVWVIPMDRLTKRAGGESPPKKSGE